MIWRPAAAVMAIPPIMTIGRRGNSTIQNLEDFLGHTRPGAAVDFGVEWLVKPQTVNVYDEGDSYYDYNWKIGVSLLDVGENVYKYGSQSRVIGEPKTNVADSELDEKFDVVKSLAGFNDSMSTIVNSFNRLQGLF